MQGLRVPVLLFLTVFLAVPLFARQAEPTPQVAFEFIRKRKYDEAHNVAEQIMETNPNHPAALAAMGAISIYQYQDFRKAEGWFQKSLSAGGEARFYVTLTRETIMSSNLDDVRGWIRLSKGRLEFIQLEGDGDFNLNLTPAEISEIKQNRTAARTFHLKVGKNTLNFKPRSADEQEVLLLIVLYQKYVTPK